MSIFLAIVVLFGIFPLLLLYIQFLFQIEAWIVEGKYISINVDRFSFLMVILLTVFFFFFCD